MATRRLAVHNVIGVFPAFEPAADALDQLIADGFEPRGELSLLGPEHEMRPAVGHLSEANGEGATGTATGLVAGAATGGAVGTAVVTLGALAVTAIPGVGLGIGAAALAGAVTGAGSGSTVGALLGLEAAGRRTTMWQQTLSPHARRVSAEGVTLVAVHVEDADRAATARTLLEGVAAEVHDQTAEIDYDPERLEANLGVTIPSGAPDATGGAMGPGKEDHPQPNA